MVYVCLVYLIASPLFVQYLIPVFVTSLHALMMTLK